ncbi:MAG TPA: ATP-binding cassette domain-containing protein [Candidatus Dormibacteraeota bacterium]
MNALRADTAAEVNKVPNPRFWSGLRPPWVLVPIAAAVVALLMPTLAPGPFILREIELICIYGLVVVGLNFSYGFAGELALGQAAMFAAGAYTGALLSIHGYDNLLITVPVTGLVAAVIGFLSGSPGLRLGGWALAMCSFFLVLLVPDMAGAFPNQVGGFTGLSPIPFAAIQGVTLDSTGLYVSIVVVTIVGFAAFRNLVKSRHGVALQVLRQSPILASSLGMSVYRLKLMAYVIGAVPAGIAGGLLDYLNSWVGPGEFDFTTTIAFLAASIIGGSRTIYGALVGSAILQLGPLRTAQFQQWSLVTYGIFLVAGGVLLAGGSGGTLGNLVRRLRRRIFRRPLPEMRPKGEVSTFDLGEFPGEELTVDNVSKRFGGLQALADVSIAARPGQVTGIIGPNGSGKTTLLNLISGFYRQERGDIKLGARSIALKSPPVVARLGVSRTFQTPMIPDGLTCLQIVASSRYARDASGLVAAMFRLPSYRRRVRTDEAEAARLLEAVGLGHLKNVEGASLPLGTRRLLEVARALAARPALLMFDEPASGLDLEDVNRLARLIRATAAAGASVVVIEHNYHMMLEVADVIHVLREGRLIATGTPDEVRKNPAVLESYLGEPARGMSA